MLEQTGRLLWISNVLPMDTVNKLKLSVAGKKMDLNLIFGFSQKINCDVLSVSDEGYGQVEKSELFKGVEFYQIARESGNIIIKNRKKERQIKKFLVDWCKKHYNCNKYVLITNYPLCVCRPLLKLKKREGVRIFSLVEDYFTLNQSLGVKNKILNIYNKYYYNKGMNLLNYFDGIIALNENIRKFFNNEVNFYKTMIGISENQFFGEPRELQQPIKLAFAGTLVSSNGIDVIMDAFTDLPQDKFELHIFGFGPLEKKVKLFCDKQKNAFFYGQISSDSVIRKLSEMDILLNVLFSSNNCLMDFNFPSKIVDYICSGRVVISTEFSGFPNEYKDFVFIVPSEEKNDLVNTILSISKMPNEQIIDRCKCGQKFVATHQKYQTITDNIISFIKGI